MSRATPTLAVLILCGVALSGCAKHVPEPTPHPSRAHITWSIAKGETDKEVCKSTEAARCVLDLSGEQANRRYGIFHVFLHAGESDTKYEGTVTVGFLGATSTPQHVQKVDRVVPRGGAPVNVSSTGIVKPAGTYYVEVSLSATPASGTGSPMPFKERIEVQVK